jgi:hypothetical protein
MKFIFETSPLSTTVYTKERFRKKEFIGTYPVPIGTVLAGIENMFLDIGCNPEAVKKTMDSLKYEPTKGENVIDIQDGKEPGTYKIRELKWFLNFPYYKTVLIVKAESTDEILKVIAESMPDHVAIDFKTNLPLNLGKVDEDNRRTTATNKKKRSGSGNSSRRKLAIQKPRSKTKKR